MIYGDTREKPDSASVARRRLGLFRRVPGAGCRVPGAGCRVAGAGWRVPGAGVGVRVRKGRANESIPNGPMVAVAGPFQEPGA